MVGRRTQNDSASPPQPTYFQQPTLSPWGVKLRPTSTMRVTLAFLIVFVTTGDTNTGPDQFNLIVPGPISAHLGSSVTLPCAVSPTFSVVPLKMRWHRPNLFRTPVLLYENKRIQQDPAGTGYRGRVSLVGSLEQGDVSMRLENIKLTDNGTYLCYVQSAVWYEEASVTLNVEGEVIGTVPFLNVSKVDDCEVNVTCTSDGWFPMPALTCTSGGGEKINHVNTVYTTDDQGLVSVSSWLLHSPSESESVSCSVGLSEQKRKEDSVVLFVCTKPKGGVIIVIILVLVLLILIITAVIVYIKVKENEKLTREKVELTREKNNALTVLQKQTDSTARRLAHNKDRAPLDQQLENLTNLDLENQRLNSNINDLEKKMEKVKKSMGKKTKAEPGKDQKTAEPQANEETGRLQQEEDKDVEEEDTLELAQLQEILDEIKNSVSDLKEKELQNQMIEQERGFNNERKVLEGKVTKLEEEKKDLQSERRQLEQEKEDLMCEVEELKQNKRELQNQMIEQERGFNNERKELQNQMIEQARRFNNERKVLEGKVTKLEKEKKDLMFKEEELQQNKRAAEEKQEEPGFHLSAAYSTTKTSGIEHKDMPDHHSAAYLPLGRVTAMDIEEKQEEPGFHLSAAYRPTKTSGIPTSGQTWESDSTSSATYGNSRTAYLSRTLYSQRSTASPVGEYMHSEHNDGLDYDSTAASTTLGRFGAHSTAEQKEQPGFHSAAAAARNTTRTPGIPTEEKKEESGFHLPAANSPARTSGTQQTWEPKSYSSATYGNPRTAYLSRTLYSQRSTTSSVEHKDVLDHHSTAASTTLGRFGAHHHPDHPSVAVAASGTSENIKAIQRVNSVKDFWKQKEAQNRKQN